MDRVELAKKYFLEGANCAQAVVLAFKDKLKLDEGTLTALSLPFGGGLGRMREVCGAVSGASIVLGILEGSEDFQNNFNKKEIYAKVQAFSNEFIKYNNSIVCKELLGLSKASNPNPSERNDEFYKKRPCVELVGMAVEIMEKILVCA